MVEATRGKDGKFTGSIGIGKTKIPTAMKSALEPLIKKVQENDKAFWQDVHKPHESLEQNWAQYERAIKDRKRVAWQEVEEIQRYQGSEGTVEAVQVVHNPYWAVQWLRMSGYEASFVTSSIELTTRAYTPAAVIITATEGSERRVERDEWLIKSEDGTFSISDNESFRGDYKSMGIEFIDSLHAEDTAWWESLSVGKTLDGRYWVRHSCGDSRGDENEYDWNPLTDIASLHQMIDGISIFNTPGNLSHKAAFIASAQSLKF